jgi:hypothetical protein
MINERKPSMLVQGMTTPGTQQYPSRTKKTSGATRVDLLQMSAKYAIRQLLQAPPPHQDINKTLK